jgi:5-methylcytosine-specific restriction endonuclease McrA
MTRIYDTAAWKRARASYLRKHPLCRMHGERGRVVAATVVDHVVPVKDRPDLAWSSDNWQPLCRDCHEIHKKRIEQGSAPIGCTIDGLPIDPGHHWHKG